MFIKGGFVPPAESLFLPGVFSVDFFTVCIDSILLCIAIHTYIYIYIFLFLACKATDADRPGLSVGGAYLSARRIAQLDVGSAGDVSQEKVSA